MRNFIAASPPARPGMGCAREASATMSADRTASANVGNVQFLLR